MSASNAFMTSAQCTDRLTGQEWKLYRDQILIPLPIYNASKSPQLHAGLSSLPFKKKKKISCVNYKAFQGFTKTRCWKTVKVLKFQQAPQRPFEVCGGSLRSLHCRASESPPAGHALSTRGGKPLKELVRRLGEKHKEKKVVKCSGYLLWKSPFPSPLSYKTALDKSQARASYF